MIVRFNRIGHEDFLSDVLAVPRVGETVLTEDKAYHVCKVAHPVASRNKTPVVYLYAERTFSDSEEHYSKDEL